jgi:hypothetical protein
MFIDRFNLMDFHPQKIFKSLFLFGGLILLLNFLSTPQLAEKEKLESLIRELSPTHSLKEHYENIEFTGFDIQDENNIHLDRAKFNFSPGSQFSIVLYGKVRNIQEKDPLRRLNARLTYENGAYFRTTNVAYIAGIKVTDETIDRWKIGGVYKIKFAFQTPEYAFPGTYKLAIARGRYDDPEKGSPMVIHRIKIKIKRKKIQKIENMTVSTLSLGGCLLNPAIQMNSQVRLPWTGNIEFYIDENLEDFKKIIVSAKGTPSSGIYPLLKVFVTDIEIGSTYINSEWKDYIFDLELSKERHILKIRLDKNERRPDEDRDVYIKMVKLSK